MDTDHPVQENLRYLHGAYLERFMADNNRIWVTAATLAPLSLGAFPFFLTMEDPTVATAIVFGVASTALMAFWFVVAEAHKAFALRSERVLAALEEALSADADELLRDQLRRTG